MAAHIDVERYGDVIMSANASQITSLTVVYSIVYSGADQGKHQSSASLAFVRGIHRWPVNSPHKGPVTQKMLPFDDVIMSMWPLDESIGQGFSSNIDNHSQLVTIKPIFRITYEWLYFFCWSNPVVQHLMVCIHWNLYCRLINPVYRFKIGLSNQYTGISQY